MAKATYYNEIGEGREFEVLATNADKTIDIGTIDEAGKKIVVVQKVPVSDGPKSGCVTVAPAPAKPAEKPAEKPVEKPVDKK